MLLQRRRGEEASSDPGCHQSSFAHPLAPAGVLPRDQGVPEKRIMVSANGNTPIIFLRRRWPTMYQKRTSVGKAAPAIVPPMCCFRFLSCLRCRAQSTGVNPALGTGQVADYGRLRWASIQPEK